MRHPGFRLEKGSGSKLGLKRYSLVLGLLLIIALVVIAVPVSAALPVTVNTAAELESNVTSATSGEIIILNPGTYDVTGMTVSASKTIEANTSALPEAGNPTNTFINGGNNEIFGVNNGVSFAINNLTLENGQCSIGGAIYNQGTLTIFNSTFTNCTAPSGSSIGGAIFNEGTLTITSSTFTDCTATNGGGINSQGGAIFNDGTITSITSSTFSGCTASCSGDGFGFGGAIYNAGTITSITSSTFSGCTASGSGVGFGGGGAIYNAGTITSITSSTFSGCTASGRGGAGGAIYNNGPAPVINSITSSTFSGCTASTFGGAIFNTGTLAMSFSRIYNDSTTAFCADGTTTVMDNWWGTNSGPGGAVDELGGTTTDSPWLVLNVTPNPSSLSLIQTSAIRANLTYACSASSCTDTTSGGTFVPAGIPVAFSVTGVTGTFSPSAGNMTSGANKTTFHPGSSGTGTVNAIVDGQTVSTALTVFPVVVTSVSPATGSSLGGTPVTITGSNFTGATGVSFGGIPATPFTVVSDSEITTTTPPTTAAGYVDVSVTVPGNTSAANPPADYFGYLPVITSISPVSGSTLGNNEVTITGAGFYGVTSVEFGSQTVDAHTFSATIINATAPPNLPAGALGTVNVTLTTISYSMPLYSVNTSASKYTYLPGVTGIEPSSGPTSGGTLVTITGAGFAGATGVLFGGIANTTPITVTGDTQITVASPSDGTPGAVDVTVVTPGGTSTPTPPADQFTYIGPPTITSIIPSTGSTAGGTAVTITGTYLTDATAVDFGTTAATITADTATSITVTTPPGTAGLTGVVVYTPGGNTGPVPGNTFTYIIPPTPTPTTAQSSHGSSTDYWINTGNTGTTSGYTGPASTPAPASPTSAPTVMSTASDPVTAAATPSPAYTQPLPTNTPKSGIDAIPVIGALGLCGVIVLFRKNGN